MTSTTQVHNGLNHVVEEKQKIYKWDIVWPNVLKFVILHIIALNGLYYYICYSTLMTKIFMFIYAEIMFMSSTAGSHRLYAHRSYKAKPLVRYFLVCLQAGELQNTVLVWARDHRVHHKYTDTDADPHNSKRGFFFSHMGWLLVKKQNEVKIKGESIDISDITNDEAVKFQLKYYYPLALTVGFALPSSVAFFICGESSFLMCLQMSVARYIISLHRVWFINSLAHMYGYTPYDKNISAKQNRGVAIVSSGEGYHNYHHVFPWDYRTGELGGHRHNLTSYFIDLMALIGLVYDRRIVSKDLIQKRRNRTGKEKTEVNANRDVNGTALWGIEDEDMPKDLINDCMDNLN